MLIPSLASVLHPAVASLSRRVNANSQHAAKNLVIAAQAYQEG